MGKFKQVQEVEDGWSEWQYPVMTEYRMGCCDCGLVHDVDFQVVKVVGKTKDGDDELRELDPREYRVLLRARRNNRSTGQIRRHM